jgi:hypothetical protein
MNTIETRVISREDYYKIHGLIGLAKEHNAAVKVIERAMAAIVGEEDDGYGFGHVSDVVYDANANADNLLRSFGIEVAQ